MLENSYKETDKQDQGIHAKNEKKNIKKYIP